jgi:hypothetical protein
MEKEELKRKSSAKGVSKVPKNKLIFNVAGLLDFLCKIPSMILSKMWLKRF